jgi:ribosomal protein S18 acetylase RimI-like enzyme
LTVPDVRAALPEDAAAIVGLRNAAARRLVARGITQWSPDEVTSSTVAAQVPAGEWFVHEVDGRVAGCLRLIWSDDEVWGGRSDADVPAGYVHGLVVDPALAPPGLGAALLAWAEEQVAARGRRLLRLDCVEGNGRLRRYYRERGFTEVGRRDFDGAWLPAVLFEKAVVAA